MCSTRQTEQPAWTLEMDLGVRPMTFSSNADGSTKWLFVQLSGFNGFAVVDFAARKEINRIKNPDLPPGKSIVPAGSDPSHGMAVTADNKTLVVCSRINNFLYAYSLPELKLLGGAELGGKGAGWVTLTPGRQDGLCREPRHERRLGRRREVVEGGRRGFRSATCRSATRPACCSSMHLA